jgi:two-component system sporulation sensor kinase B
VAKPDKNKSVEIVDVKIALQSVTDLIKSYGLLHDNDIDLTVQENLFITINIIEFKQLMINLIKNAIEASNHGDLVLIRSNKIKNYVEIQIIDFGCGMSEEEVNYLGTPFYSLKCKGTGLGMMICFNIVEKYQGTIQFNSIKGKGTTINIRFPFIPQ